MSDYGVLVFAVVIQLLLALTAARVAEDRGRSFWVYAVFCFFIPLAAVIAIPYLLVFARKVPSDQRQPRRVPVRFENGDAPRGRIDELERLARLRAEGALTEEEFTLEKSRVLNPGLGATETE